MSISQHFWRTAYIRRLNCGSFFLMLLVGRLRDNCFADGLDEKSAHPSIFFGASTEYLSLSFCPSHRLILLFHGQRPKADTAKSKSTNRCVAQM